MDFQICLVTLALLITHAVICSSLKLEERIIGGVEVMNRCEPPFSWIVGLRTTSLQGPVTFCSAVMLDNTTLVTSGRCIYQFVNTNNDPGVAVVGERDLVGNDREEQTIPIQGIRVHPRYDRDTYDNNIGLVRLSYPARLGRCVRPAFKMEEDPNACPDMDTSCLMAGWGPYTEGSRPTNSRVLRSAPLTVYGDFVTLQLELTRTQNAQPLGAVYAEPVNPNQKACFFDWGGVVGCQRNGHFVLRGVIGEHNCNANPTPPVMITDVQMFEQWIQACKRNWNSLTCTGTPSPAPGQTQ